MKQNIGLKFYDYEYKLQMIWGTCSIKGEERYVVNDPYKDDDRIYGDLYTEESMNEILSKQNDFLKGMETKKQREIESEIEEKAALKAKQEEEYLYGFDEGLTPMQKGKLLKILLKKFNYPDGYGVMTRKDYIVRKISEGCYLNIKTFSKYHSNSNDNGEEIVRMLSTPNKNLFNEITKTEYDFANYLIENNILKKEA